MTAFLASSAMPLAALADSPVPRGETTTMLTVAPNPAGLLAAITLTATVSVTPPASGTPTGLVRFRANGSVIGSASVTPAGLATLTTSLVVSGSVNLTANYVGDNSFAPSTSAIVPHQTAAVGASSLTVIATSPSPSLAGSPVTVVAVVLPLAGGTPTGSVGFSDGATPIGTGALTTFSGIQVAAVTMTPASPGVRTLTARYGGDATFAGSASPPGLHTVYAGAAPSATTTALVAAPASSLVGQSVTFTATVTRAAGGIPTGTVDFYAYGALIGSQALATTGGTAKAALAVTSLPKGLAPIAAAYRGNATSAASATGLPVFQCVDCAAANATPLAKAGPIQAVAPGSVVQLDGSASSDLEGAPLTYTWTNITTAPFQPATLSNAASARPTFVAGPGEAAYAFDLVVSDGNTSSPPDRVYIVGTTTYGNARPVAQAGPDQYVEAGQGITLNGGASFDSDGQPLALTYQWVLRSRPTGSTAELSSSTSPSPTFFLDLEGRYEFELVVFDGATASTPDRVVVATNHPPIARAGDDQERTAGTTAHLSGAGSTDIDGQPLTYTWTLLSAPVGSTTALSSTSAVRPTLPIDVGGNYVVRLIVSDGTDASEPDTITISTGDLPPVADPGPAQRDPGPTPTPGPLGEDGVPVSTVTVGQTVRLDGTGSFDPNFQFLTSLGYQWTLVQRPAGSTAVLTSPTSARPTFVADLAGDYVARLVVSSGALSSVPRDIRISTGNSRPMANAGRSQTVATGGTVHLDGTGSTDVNGNPLSYQWSFLTKPAGSAAALSGDTSPRPMFIADVGGTYVAQLVVSDGVYLDAATVLITTGNVAPIGRAGADQAIPVPSSVTLDGSASSDENFDPLLYRWVLTRKPAGSGAVLTGGTTAAPAFSVDVAGDYVAQLRVSDGSRFGTVDTVMVTTANARPLANAGDDLNAAVGGVVSLDGTGSSDANGDPLSYQWAMLYRPGGSGATLSNPAAAEPSFVADVAGTYIVQLTVADATLRSAPDVVTITTVGAPTAVAIAPDAAYTGASVPLDGSASTDPQLLPLTYLWSFGSRPAGSVASIANPLAAMTAFTPDLVGTYVVCLVVSNGAVASAPDCTAVMVSAAPALTLSPGVVNLALNESATMTVTLNQPAGFDLTVSLVASGTTAVTVPPTVTVPTGQSSAIFDVTAGPSDGTATIAASAGGYVGDLAFVNVSVTGIAITLGSGLVVAPDQIRDLSVTLSEPAPAGGVLISFTSSNPAIASVTPSVFIPDGADVPPLGNPQVIGHAYGIVEITATAASVSGDTELVAVARSIRLSPPAYNVVIGGSGSLLLQASAPAPAGGLGFNVSTGSPGVVTGPATVTIPPNQLSASIELTGQQSGSRTVTVTPADPADTSTASATVFVNPAQPLNLQNITVGKNLMTVLNGSLGSPAPAGGRQVTIESVHPLAILVAADGVSPGTTSIVLTVPAGSTQFPPIYVHGLVDTGGAIVRATSPGLPEAVASVDLVPSGFVLGIGNFVTGLFSPNTALPIYPFRLDPLTLMPLGRQPLRPGVNVSIPVSTSNLSVGAVTSPVAITGPSDVGLSSFDPTGSGTTRIGIGTAAGFSIPATGTVITATVAAPLTFSSSTLTVGRDLQALVSLNLGSPAPAGNLPVTITSADPSKVLLSKTAAAAGSASISLVVPAGSTNTPAFFVQALDQSGTVQVTAAAANYDPASLPVTLAPSGVVFGTASFTTHPASPNTTLTLATAWLEPGTLAYAGLFCERCQAVRAGFASFQVTVSSSDNPTGSVPNPATFNAGSSTAITEFDPHAAGAVTLSIVTPTGFSTPASGTQIQVNITTETATLSAGSLLIGKNLQSANGVGLGTPAPAGNLLVTIQSADPSRVLLSTTPTSPAMDTISLTVPAGQSASPQFYVHALGATGAVAVNLTAPGYVSGSFDVTLKPSGFIFRSSSFSTSTLSADTPLEIRAVWLDEGTLDYPVDPFCTRCQALATGVTAEITVASAPTTVGTITISPVTIAPSTGVGVTAFHPLSGGTATLSLGTPPGFSTPSTFREITASVGNPPLSIADLTVGKDLESGSAVNLGAPAEAGGATVTVSTVDPNVRLSTSPTSAGSSSIVLNVTAGASQSPTFYVQALTASGAAQIGATANGYSPATATVSFRPSGFVFASGDFVTGALSSNRTLTLRSVWLDPVTLTWNVDPVCASCQALRGGISPVAVTVISSNPAVGTITGPAIFAGGTVTATTEFDPQANGSSTLTIEAPDGFSASGNFASIVATVQPAVQLGGEIVGRDLQSPAAGSLTALAPAGNLLVTLNSADPSKLLLATSPTAPGQASIAVSVPAGSNSFTYFVQALSGTGSAQVLATAPGHTDALATITLVPSGFVLEAADFSVSPAAANVPLTVRSVRLDPDFLNYLIDPSCTACQPVRPGIDVTVPVTSSNETVGSIVGATHFIGGVGTQVVHFDPLTIGTTTVALGLAPAPFSTPSNFQFVEVTVATPPPLMSLPAQTVGKNLQVAAHVTLHAFAPAGNLQVTITSADPDKVLLSSSPTTAGGGSLTITTPADENITPEFYVQALSDTGTVQLTMTAPGFTTSTAQVTLVPSGFVIETPNFVTSPTAVPHAIQVRAVRLDPVFLNYAPHPSCDMCQSVRGGLTVDVSVVSADPGIGTITLSPLTFNGNEGLKSTAFDGVTAGLVAVSLTAPDGFETPSNQQSIDVTVTNSYIALSAVTLGKNLQAPITGSLGEPAPAGNLTITMTSGDPAKLLLSNSSSIPGSASISVVVPAGSTIVPPFYVQALDLSGAVPLEASAPQFIGNPISVTLVPSAFAFMIPSTFVAANDDFTTTSSSSDTLLTIQPVRLDPVTLNVPPPISSYCFSICQMLRPGMTASVGVISSDPSVGTITNSPLTFDHTIQNGADAVFDPLAGGTTTLTIVAPPGFAQPSTRGSLVATVTAPPLSVGARSIGKNLQAPTAVQLGAPAPAGNLPLTITSSDPSKLLLSTDGGPGSTSIVVTVPAGQSSSPQFYVQSLADTGVVDVMASAPGYAGGSGQMTLEPSGFVISYAYWCIPCFFGPTLETTAGAANYPLYLASARLDRSTLNYLEVQNVRGGLSVPVTVSTTPAGIGTIVPTPVTFTGGAAFDSGIIEFGFDPSNVGTTVLEVVTPAGFSQSSNLRTISANVSAAALSLGSPTIGKNLQVELVVALGEPAPAGGLDVTVTSADPSKVLVSTGPATQGSGSVTVHATAGLNGVTIYAQALGDAGAVDLTASAPGRASGTGTVTLFPSGFIITPTYWCPWCSAPTLSTTTGAANTQLYVVAGRLTPGTLAFEQGAQQNVRGGLSVDVTVSSTATVGSNVVAMVPPTVTFTGGIAFESSVVGIQADPISAGTAVLEVVPPPGFATPINLRQITATVSGPTLSMFDLALGRDLQGPVTVFLQEPAPAGGVDVTLQSADASKVLISPDPASAGAASATLNVPAGAQSATFYAQALASSGSVALTAAAPGFSQGASTVTLQPSGFIITQAYWCLFCFAPSFNTTTGSPNTPLDVVAARLNPGTFAYEVSQPVRGGITVNVTVQSTDSTGTNVGSMTPATVSFTGNVFVVQTAFDPANAGTAIVEPVPPAGFTPPSNFRQLTANVTAPGIVLSVGIVGKDLQSAAGGTLAAPAPAGGLSLTIVSSDTSRLRLALSPTDPGGSSITFEVPEGSTSVPTFYVQALDGSGSVDITANAAGYTSGTAAVPLAPSGFVSLSPGGNFTTTTLSDPTTLSVYSVVLSPTLTYLTTQPVRPGATVDVTVTAADATGTGVGTIAGSPVTFNGNEGVHQVFYDPAALGSSVVTIQTPAGFSTPGNLRVFTVTVNAPPMFVGDALLGKDLQTAMAGSLGGVSQTAVTFTITSSDPSKVLVSALPTTAGAASIMITSPGPTSVIPVFYVQGLADSGSVALTISAPGFMPTTAQVTLTPSGFIIQSPNGLTTQGNAASTEFQIASARLAPVSLAFQTGQPLRPGAAASVTVTSTAPAVGAITLSPVVFAGNQGLRSTFFDPQPVAVDGTTTVQISTPAGYSTPSQYQQVEVSVQAVIVDPNATSNYAQWLLGAPAAPNVATFEPFAGGAILSGSEYASSGLTITQRDGYPMRIASAGDGSFVLPGNFNSPTRGLTSSFLDDSKSENYDFSFAHTVMSAGLWIGHLNPEGPTVLVQFLDSADTVLQSYTAAAADPNLVGAGGYDTRLFVGFNSSVPISRIRVFNGVGDGDGIVFDDITFSGTFTTLALTPGSSSVGIGATTPLELSMSQALPADLTVALVSSDPTAATVPASVIIPAGSTSASFDVTGHVAGGALITASAPAASTAKAVVAVAGNVVEWISNASGNWSNGANWSTGAPPTPADVVRIDRPGTITVTVDTSSAAARTLLSLEPINIPGILTIHRAAALDGGFSLIGVLAGGGTVTARGASTWNGGTIANGGLDIEAGQTLAVATGNDHHLTSTALRTHGITSWTGGVIYLDNGSSIVNDIGAYWDVRGNLQLAANGNGANAFTNLGTVRKSAGVGQFTIGGGGVAFTNAASGTLAVETGTLGNASGVALNNSGRLSVASGATIQLNEFNLQSSSTFSGGGTLLANGTTTITGNVTMPVDLTIINTLTGSGHITAASTVVWQSGLIGNAGGLTIAPGHSLAVTTGNDHHLTSAPLTNAGTTTWNAGVIYVNNGGSIVNAAGALWDAQGNLQLAANGNGLNTFTNHGTFRKSAGIGQFTVGGGGLRWTSDGAMEIQSGTLANAAGFALINSGSIAIGAGATMQLNDVTLESSSTFSGAGTLLANGTTTINGSVTTPVALTIINTLTGPGHITAEAPVVWQSGTIGNAGGLTIAPGHSLAILTGNDHNLTSAPLINAGTTTWNAGVVALNNGGSIVNAAGALWDAQGNLQMAANGNGLNTFTNHGTFRKSAGTGQFTVGGGGLRWSSDGAMEIQAGTLANGSGVALTIAGSIAVGTDATMQLNDVTLESSSTFSGAGSLVANGLTTINGTVTLPVALTIVNTLTGGGQLIAQAPVVWQSGTIGNSGGLTIAAGNSLAINTGNDHNLTSSVLHNAGTVAWNAGVVAVNNGGGIVNAAGGLWDVQGNLQLAANGNGANTFLNQGTFRKSSGTGQFTIGGGGIAWTNTGTMDVQAGTVANASGHVLTNSGAISVASNAAFQLSDVRLELGTVLTGAGTLLANGTATVAADVTSGVALTIIGTLTGAGRLTAAAPVSWESGTIGNAGGLDVDNGQAMAITSGNDHNLTSSVLRNRGTVSWTAGSLAANNGASILNEGAGTWEFGSSLSLNGNGNGANSFVNAGRLRFTGSAHNFSTSSLAFSNSGTIEVRLFSNGAFDRLLFGTNVVALGGTLDVRLEGGFVPAVADQFIVITYPAATGTFSTINGNGHVYAVCYSATAVTLGDPGNALFCGGS